MRQHNSEIASQEANNCWVYSLKYITSLATSPIDQLSQQVHLKTSTLIDVNKNNTELLRQMKRKEVGISVDVT